MAVAVIAAAILSGPGARPGVTSVRTSTTGAEHRPAPRTHVVEIREFGYEPSDLVVSAGDTVRWINRDPVPHTVTARDSTWSSDRIEAGGQWQMVVRAGVNPGYFCIHHPVMTGTIRVVRAGGS